MRLLLAFTKYLQFPSNVGLCRHGMYFLSIIIMLLIVENFNHKNVNFFILHKMLRQNGGAKKQECVLHKFLVN